ncbi:hypothetical protein M901_0663 [Bacteriovorax sp. DB6_IX]|nr:hypothetical protein M901_0663 [Bacteriovorax sp. DB6_IX]
MTNEIRWKIFFSFLSIGNLINGLWMLIHPKSWYLYLPGRVSDFGPMNEHFIRDLGCLYTIFGVLSAKAFVDKSKREDIHALMTLFSLGHVVVHLFDTLRGLVAFEHLYMDFPLVYAPTIVMAILFILLKKEKFV